MAFLRPRSASVEVRPFLTAEVTGVVMRLGDDGILATTVTARAAI